MTLLSDKLHIEGYDRNNIWVDHEVDGKNVRKIVRDLDEFAALLTNICGSADEYRWEDADDVLSEAVVIDDNEIFLASFSLAYHANISRNLAAYFGIDLPPEDSDEVDTTTLVLSLEWCHMGNHWEFTVRTGSDTVDCIMDATSHKLETLVGTVSDVKSGLVANLRRIAERCVETCKADAEVTSPKIIADNMFNHVSIACCILGVALVFVALWLPSVPASMVVTSIGALSAVASGLLMRRATREYRQLKKRLQDQLNFSANEYNIAVTAAFGAHVYYTIGCRCVISVFGHEDKSLDDALDTFKAVYAIEEFTDVVDGLLPVDAVSVTNNPAKAFLEA